MACRRPASTRSRTAPAACSRKSRLPCLARVVTVALALLSVAAAPAARARVEAGATLEPLELPTLAGGVEPLTAKTAVNVILFWRPDQAHSLDTLKQMAQCEKIFGGKPIHMVAVVSGAYPRAAVKAAVDDAALHVPVLIDAGDELYGKLEIIQHPLVVVADAKGKVALSQPYLRLRLCEIVHAHVRYLLKEIDAVQLEAAIHPPRASFPDDNKANIARRFVKMGKLEAEGGSCDKALESFRKALEITPGDPEALAGVAACDPSAAKPIAAKE